MESKIANKSDNKSLLHKYLTEKPKFTKAVVCFLLDGNKVLLGQRKKVSNDLGLNIVAGIGGKLEAGESSEYALVREVQEEIGVRLLNYQQVGRVKFIVPHKPLWNQDVAIFTADEWEGQPVETEAMLPKWYKTNELPIKQMWQDNLVWLPQILVGKKIEGVFLLGEEAKVIEYELKPFGKI